MGLLEEAMKSTVRQEIMDAVAGYEDKLRDQWLFDYSTQVSLTASQIWWATDVEIAFERFEEGFENALKDYNRKQVIIEYEVTNYYILYNILYFIIFNQYIVTRLNEFKIVFFPFKTNLLVILKFLKRNICLEVQASQICKSSFLSSGIFPILNVILLLIKIICQCSFSHTLQLYNHSIKNTSVYNIYIIDLRIGLFQSRS